MRDSLQTAFKTTLSMLLALYFALSLGWDKPIWAVMTVFFISLGSVGASLQKGVQRMAGTLAGAALAVLLSALLAQQMWPFMLTLAVVLYGLTYIATVSRSAYVYQMAALVLLLIVTSAVTSTGMSSNLTLTLIIARVQETLLGVVCFTLVDVLLWPKRQRDVFDASLTRFAEALQRLIHSNMQAASAGQALRELPEHASARSLMPLLDQLQLLQRASRYELSPRAIASSTWQNFTAHTNALCLSLSQFRWHYDTLRGADLRGLQLCSRWARLQALLSGLGVQTTQWQAPIETPEESPAPTAQHATALRLLNRDLDALEQHLACLARSYAHLLSGHRETLQAPARQRHRGYWHLERLYAALIVPITLLLSFVIWQHVRVPAGTLFIYLSCTLAITLTIMPGLPLRQAAVPIFVGIALAFLQYTLVMPLLSEFYQLATLLFINFFLLLWLCRQPQQALTRLAVGVGGLLIFAPALEVRPSFSALGAINTWVLLYVTLFAYLWLHHLWIPQGVKIYQQRERAFFQALHWQAAQAFTLTHRLRGLAWQRFWRDQSTLAQAAAIEQWAAANAPAAADKDAVQQRVVAFYVLSTCLANATTHRDEIRRACAAAPALAGVAEQLLHVVAILAGDQNASPGQAQRVVAQCQATLDQWWASAPANQPDASVASGVLHLFAQALQRYLGLQQAQAPALLFSEA